jgi:hypothetical protein
MPYWERIKTRLKKFPGTIRLYWFIKGLQGIKPITRPKLDRGPMPRPDFSQLETNYRQSPLFAEPDSFILYRIIGNDLTPRHRKGQSRDNLKFIIENEPEFPGCEKRFVINRIVDSDEENAIITCLETAGFHYLHIPFRLDEYKKIQWDIPESLIEYAPYTEKFTSLTPYEQERLLMRLYRHKNNYVMNNNGARNAALAEGRTLAKWVLPFDGNCFISATGWQEIVAAVKQSPHIPYFIVPMARITDNRLVLTPGFKPAAAEEPQILFRRDSRLFFNEDYFYGRRPKVELLLRLGVPGAWEQWPFDPWDLAPPRYAAEAGCFTYAGYVFRLDSGKAELEVSNWESFIERGLVRNQSIFDLLDRLDEEVCSTVNLNNALIVQPSIPPAFSGEGGQKLQELLFNAAEDALGRGPYSVIDKTVMPPSGDPHDYFHPAPDYWPNPLTPSGKPYIKKDGQRVPGTNLYEPESEKYDRTRLQRLFDDTLVLSLAWRNFNDQRFLDHAVTLIRTWFLDPATAMNPSLAYAQVQLGHNNDQGSHYGIIEMKDLYFFLDAVRIVEAAGGLDLAEQNSLRDWLRRYLQWLQSSTQGRQERAALNNHGTYYDLQVAYIAAFLEEKQLLRDTFRDSRFRILSHFDSKGRQPEEMKRNITAHYCCFNLQGWIHLARLAESCHEDLWRFEGDDGRGIRAAMGWLIAHLGRKWPYEQISPFDDERFFPIYYACKAQYGIPPAIGDRGVPEPWNIKPIFYPHDGIRPFWQL